MNTVIRHIEYLLSRTDCVIVPDFGAFLAHYESARIDVETMRVYPPQRKFTYNASLTQTDGTIACSIARQEGISYESAKEIVADEVNAMKQQLMHDCELTIGRIGTLKYDAEAEIIDFQPFDNDRISPLAALPIVDANVTTDNSSYKIVHTGSISPFARFVRVAASIALLLGICFVASTPITVDEAAMASLSPELKPIPIEEMLPAEPAEEAIPTLNVYTSHPDYLSIDVAPKSKSNGRYCIIIASLANVADAERFISESKYPNLTYFEANGRYRICADRFDTEADAYRQLSKAAYAGQGAWVCKQ